MPFWGRQGRVFEVGSVPENPISLVTWGRWDDDDVLYDRRQGFFLRHHKLEFQLLSQRASSETLHQGGEPTQSPALILSALLCVCFWELGLGCTAATGEATVRQCLEPSRWLHKVGAAHRCKHRPVDFPCIQWHRTLTPESTISPSVGMDQKLVWPLPPP